MDHSISGLLLGLDPYAVTLLAGGGFGIMLSRERRHSLFAMALLLAAIVASALYPVLWSHNSPQAFPTVLFWSAGWGALMGVAFYGVILWFKNESMHAMDDSKSVRTPNDDD